MKTYQATPKEVVRAWHVIDAKDKVLGQVARDAAIFLMGKHKVTFTPHVDSGDFVIVINADTVAVTGRKATDKMYYSHSGIPQGFKQISFEKLMEKDSRKVILHAVKGMLPKNKQQDPRLARLKIFAGSEHDYQDKFVTNK